MGKLKVNRSVGKDNIESLGFEQSKVKGMEYLYLLAPKPGKDFLYVINTLHNVIGEKMEIQNMITILWTENVQFGKQIPVYMGECSSLKSLRVILQELKIIE